jgi:hypothetical protein
MLAGDYVRDIWEGRRYGRGPVAEVVRKPTSTERAAIFDHTNVASARGASKEASGQPGSVRSRAGGAREVEELAVTSLWEDKDGSRSSIQNETTSPEDDWREIVETVLQTGIAVPLVEVGLLGERAPTSSKKG